MIKELRKKNGLTQQQVADALKVSVRTYKRYEEDENKIKPITYQFLIDYFNKVNLIDETHGVLTIEQIKQICGDVFANYQIQYCYLFGSYAKGKAIETSDIDLLIATSVTGMKFYEIVEVLREKLQKKVDVLNQDQIKNNPNLVNEILSGGIKIYG